MERGARVVRTQRQLGNPVVVAWGIGGILWLAGIFWGPLSFAAVFGERDPVGNIADSEDSVAQVGRPVAVQAVDRPHDNGGSVVLTWTTSLGEPKSRNRVTGYAILRSLHREGAYTIIGRTAAGDCRYVDATATRGIPFYYKVEAELGEVTAASEPIGPVTSRRQWFHGGRWNQLLLGILLVGAFVYFIRTSQGGRPLRFRELPGVTAIDEAIAQAARVGRPIFFCPGSEDLNEIQTLAGLSILEQVTCRAAAGGGEPAGPPLAFPGHGGGGRHSPPGLPKVGLPGGLRPLR
jgi:hypothetical protein